MNAMMIDGRAIAQVVRGRWKKRVAALKTRGVTPGLAVIMIGNNPASRVYVRNKVKACAEVGLYSETHEFPADIGEEAVIWRIQELNQNPTIHGILVQLPLPVHIDAERVMQLVAPEKDIDGLTWPNLVALLAGRALYEPCMPSGIVVLLERAGIGIDGRHALC